ncbi:MAG: DUF6454 family protein [Bryobacteraceae bacterium]
MRLAKWIAVATLVATAYGQVDFTKPERVLPLHGETNHVQGIDTDGTHVWVTSVDRPTSKGFLRMFSLVDGHLEKSVEVQAGALFHPGGVATDSTSIWIPVAEYRASSTAVIQQRNKSTLELEFEFPVPDHIGCVAVTPDFIIGGNWDSREFYVWDHRGNLIRKVASETANAYQDLKVVAGKLVGSGTLAGKQGAVDWLNLGTFRLESRLLVSNTDRGEPFTREGMTIFNDRLWLLPEDSSSRLFSFLFAR